MISYVINTNFVPSGSYDGMNIGICSTKVQTVAWQMVHDLEEIRVFYTTNLQSYVFGTKVFLDGNGNVLEKYARLSDVLKVIMLGAPTRLELAKRFYVKLFHDFMEINGNDYTLTLVQVASNEPFYLGYFWIDELQEI